MLSSHHRWFCSPWTSPLDSLFPAPQVVPQTQTRFQEKLHQSHLEGEDSPAALSGVRRMNFFLSSSSPLWAASIPCSQLCLWCPYDLVTILSLPCLNFPRICKEKLPYLFHLLNHSKFVGEWHKRSKWKINTFAGQFRTQQKKKRAKCFIKSWKVQANGNFQWKLGLYFGIPQGEIGILPHCNGLTLQETRNASVSCPVQFTDSHYISQVWPVNFIK